MKKKRNSFEELVQGIEDINQHLEGKITQKTYTIQTKPTADVAPEMIRRPAKS